MTSDEICVFCERFSEAEKARPLRSTKDVLVYLDHFRTKKQEFVVCLSLDSRHRLIARRVITLGLVDTSLAHPREVFTGAVTDHAVSVIVAHNHPSGIVKPSEDDIKTTQQLVAAGILLGIPLRGHVIVAEKRHYSFRENHLL